MTDTTTTARSGSAFTSPAALVGAGVLVAALGATAGWMIHSKSPAPDAANPATALAPNETLVQPSPAASVADTAVAAAASTPAVVAPAPVKEAVHHAPAHHEPKSSGSHEGTAVAGNDASTGSASHEPVPTQHVAVCNNCGVVEGVRAVQQKGQGTGLGAVAGGVLGGVVGHQLGGGNGKTAMTVLGAIGGGLAGNEVEKRARGKTVYEVRVRMDDGSVRTLTESTAPTPGSHVVVEGSSLRVVPARDGEGT
jgi:outer membrane lipoprotein SlyB